MNLIRLVVGRDNTKDIIAIYIIIDMYNVILNEKGLPELIRYEEGGLYKPFLQMPSVEFKEKHKNEFEKYSKIFSNPELSKEYKDFCSGHQFTDIDFDLFFTGDGKPFTEEK